MRHDTGGIGRKVAAEGEQGNNAQDASHDLTRGKDLQTAAWFPLHAASADLVKHYHLFI